jgi:4'-phosphopantetheinyl transferase
LLSDEERARAARFITADLTDRFVVAHGQLRRLLGELLGQAPAALTFTAGAHGKPALGDAARDAGLHFNLSHSADRGFIGWAWGRHIGVDLERWRDMRDEAALVRRFFSPTEIAAYERLPEVERHAGFFGCWTRKEAYVKAVGRGLSLPLGSFDVTLGPGVEARLLRPSAVQDDGRQWALGAPEGPTGWSLAVVLEGEACHIQPEDAPPVRGPCEPTHVPRQ